MLILAYGIGRMLMLVLTQARDVMFTQVSANAVRQLNNRTFRHLHQLSLRFHLERRTGGLNRVIERGTNAIELLFRMGVLNVAPTVLELVLVCGMLVWFFGWSVVLDRAGDDRALHLVHVRRHANGASASAAR